MSPKAQDLNVFVSLQVDTRKALPHPARSKRGKTRNDGGSVEDGVVCCLNTNACMSL